MSERWPIAFALVGAIQLAGCAGDCAHGNDCARGLACVYDVADQTSDDAVCVRECDYDTDCTAPETCTGMGHAATSPIQLVIRFCKAPVASPRESGDEESPESTDGLDNVSSVKPPVRGTSDSP